MKVNMVTPWNVVCGNASYAKKLYSRLKEKVSIEIIEIKKPYTHNGMHFINLGRRASKNCDIIHVEHGYGVFGKLFFSGIYTPLFYLACRNKRVITTMHDVANYDKRGPCGIARKIYRRIMEHFIFFGSDIVHVHTREAAEYLESNGLDASKIVIIPLGVFETIPKMRRKRDEHITITLFGFIHRNKGHDVAIEALSMLGEKYKMIIAGRVQDDTYFEELKTMIIRHNLQSRVELLQDFDDDQETGILSRTDIIALPYRSVSQSSVLYKAAAWGIPVVASDIHFFKEIENEWGWIATFRSQAPGSMASCIKKLENKSVKKTMLKARRMFLLENSPVSVIKKLEAAYERALQ